MKKRIISFIWVMLLCLTVTVPAFASEQERVTDEANLLSEAEASALEKSLDEISERLQFDVAVATRESIDGNDAESAAYDIYDANGYGYGSDKDGALLLISIEEREWAFTAAGYGITALNEDARAFISDEVSSALADEDYAAAFTAFADACDSIVTDAKAGRTYKEPFPFARRLGMCFVISLIIAVIAIIAMKGELQSVKKQDAAGAYVKKNSLKVTNSSERFLYKNVDKTEKAQETENKANETTHIGNSGKF